MCAPPPLLPTHPTPMVYYSKYPTTVLRPPCSTVPLCISAKKGPLKKLSTLSTILRQHRQNPLNKP